MDEVTERRWKTKTLPTDHKPIDAVRMFLRQLESGELNPNHVIIVYANNEDCEGATGFFQAGDAGFHGQLGILTRCLQIMGES